MLMTKRLDPKIAPLFFGDGTNTWIIAMGQGYGLGSGISLFIATNICETIVWKARSKALRSM